MNRPEAVLFLKSFFSELKIPEGDPSVWVKKAEPFNKLVLSLKADLPVSIPLLRELAAIEKGADLVEAKTGLLFAKINRLYLRLRRTQDELGRLDLKKAAPGVSPEDYIFSRIDFSRYREMRGKDFDTIFPAGLTDFDDAFLKKNFGLSRTELHSLIKESYKKEDDVYRIKKDNPLLLSIMRTLDTSLESAPLISAGEIEQELKNLLGFLGVSEKIPGMELLYVYLVSGLGGKSVLHEDGMETRIFISPQGDLMATFRPDNKPWTRTLIPGIMNQVP